jgi:hypothetical protein
MNPKIARPLYSAIAFSALVTAAGTVIAPALVWPNVLLTGYFLAGLGLSGAFVVAVHDASSGRWLGAMRSIACGLTNLVLPGSLLVLAAISIGGAELYPAFHPGHVEGFKAIWLERWFFTARAFACVAAWLVSIAILKKGKGAPAYLVVFGITVSLTSFDWIMALEPHWPSTVFAVYHFAGMVTGAFAVMAIVAVSRSRTDPRITIDHIHDVAKLLFAFSTFWMYIWFSQGMLIWYTNIPEETAYYGVRAYGNWGVLFWSVVAIKWVLPFAVLLSAKTKRNRTILLRIAIAVLIGHWLDLYVAIVPAGMPEPALTGWELAAAVGAFAAVGWSVTRRPAPEGAVPPARLASAEYELARTS